MFVIVVFFNEARTDFLVTGPFTAAQVEGALAVERARPSNAARIDIVSVPLFAGRDK